MQAIDRTDPVRRHILAAAQHLVKVLEAEFRPVELMPGENRHQETTHVPLRLEHDPTDPGRGTPEAILRVAPILLIGDDADVCVALMLLLQHAGYEVVTAANEGEAHGLLRSGWRPGLVIIDVDLAASPLKGGSQRFREHAFADIPIVLCFGGNAVPSGAASLNVVENLRKPIEIDTLLAVVARYCNGDARVGSR